MDSSQAGVFRSRSSSTLQRVNMPRWSKLQKEIYKLLDPQLDLQIQCRVYRMESQRGSTKLPRFWVTLANEIIWEYPRKIADHNQRHLNRKSWYPYQSDVSLISETIREYTDTPKKEILSKIFKGDYWGLTNILKAADRRIGKRHWPILKKRFNNRATLKVLNLHRECSSLTIEYRSSN